MTTALGPGALLVPTFQRPNQQGVAPPGWEKTVLKMKKSGGIDNPFALAWYMKKRGMKPARHENDAAYDATIAIARTELQGHALPRVCLDAARGESYAMTQLLQAGPFMLEARR